MKNERRKVRRIRNQIAFAGKQTAELRRELIVEFVFRGGPLLCELKGHVLFIHHEDTKITKPFETLCPGGESPYRQPVEC